MMYTLAPLTVGAIWDAKKQKIDDDELPFFILARLTLKDGQPITEAEFRDLPFPIVTDLMAKLNLGNAQNP